MSGSDHVAEKDKPAGRRRHARQNRRCSFELPSRRARLRISRVDPTGPAVRRIKRAVEIVLVGGAGPWLPHAHTLDLRRVRDAHGGTPVDGARVDEIRLRTIGRSVPFDLRHEAAIGCFAAALSPAALSADECSFGTRKNSHSISPVFAFSAYMRPLTP